VEGGATSGSPTVEDLAELYRRGYHTYLRVAEAILGDVELAHDAVQEAFARAIRRRTSFRGTGTLEGWTWRTVVNAARNARRDLEWKHEPLGDLGEAMPVAVGASPGHEVRRVIAALPERQRLVLFLRYYADLDYRAIAEALELQTGTVGATLNQAHAAVRRALEEVPT
jgi:DNA-directed RNA polymerase specialized sigma24 family protein